MGLGLLNLGSSVFGTQQLPSSLQVLAEKKEMRVRMSPGTCYCDGEPPMGTQILRGPGLLWIFL